MGKVSSATGCIALFKSKNEKQTKLSIHLRITAICLGALATLVGTLALSGVRGFGQIGIIGGWTFFASGTFLFFAGTLIQGVEEHKNLESNSRLGGKKTTLLKTTFFNEQLGKFSRNSSRMDEKKSHDLQGRDLQKPHILKGTLLPKSEWQYWQVEKNKAITLARDDFIKWLNQDENALGEGEYEQAIKLIKGFSEELNCEEIALYTHNIKGTFPFYFGERPGNKSFFPIGFIDGCITWWQTFNEEASTWPVYDAQKKAYVIFKAKPNNITFSQSMKSSLFFRHLLESAKRGKNSNGYLMLEVLTPYAKNILDECGLDIYNEIVELFPSYGGLLVKENSVNDS